MFKAQGWKKILFVAISILAHNKLGFFNGYQVDSKELTGKLSIEITVNE